MTKKIVEVDGEGNTTGRIIFQFDDHKEDAPSFEVFDLKEVPEAMVTRLALHGASQKTGDSYANAAKEADPLAFAKAAVKDTIAQIYAGTWRVNSGGGPRVNDLAVAIARASGMNLEGEDGAVALVAAMSDDDKKVWRKKAKVAAELAKIAVEKAQARAEAAIKAAAAEDAKEAAAA